MRRVALLVPLAAAGIALAACSSGGTTATSPTQAPATHSASAAPKEQAVQTPAIPTLHAGQATTITEKRSTGDIKMQFTVNSVDQATSVMDGDPSNQFSSSIQADAGHRFVAVTLKVKNLGQTSTDLSVNPYFHGQDGKRVENILKPDNYMKTEHGYVHSGLNITMATFQPGEYQTGAFTVEVPTEAGKIVIPNMAGKPTFAVAVPAATS